MTTPDFSRPPIDTAWTGAGRNFPTTAWTDVREAGAEETVSRAAGMELLARHYWKPVYSYIRTRWSKPPDDARDLTQDFFLWILESGFVQRADPSRGRFRGFVKVALDHYLGGEYRKERSLKRGGSRRILSLEASPNDLESQISGMQGQPPEQILDEIWRAELLTRCRILLQESLEKDGKEKHFQVFKDYYLSDEATPPDYATVAQRHKLRESDVAHHLMDAKKRFREILSSLVAETVESPAELEEELRALFGELPK